MGEGPQPQHQHISEPQDLTKSKDTFFGKKTSHEVKCCFEFQLIEDKGTGVGNVLNPSFGTY